MGVPLVPSFRFKVSISGARLRPSGNEQPVARTGQNPRFFQTATELAVSGVLATCQTNDGSTLNFKVSQHSTRTECSYEIKIFLEVLWTIQELENDDTAKRIWLLSDE